MLASENPHWALHFMLDEETGELWCLPETSRLAKFSDPVEVSYATWLSQAEHASKDANAFFNSETIRRIASTEQHNSNAGTIGHIFCGECGVVYTQVVEITGGKWAEYGKSFYWPVSYEQHAELWAGATPQCALTLFGPPETPKIGRKLQRPSPSSIKGARRVTNYAALLASEREFFVGLVGAPFLFRDSSTSLQQHWNSTKRHKEHHPPRRALQIRQRREVEIQKLQSVSLLLERTKDPEVERQVIRNADRGVSVLKMLMREPSRSIQPDRARTSFFGTHGGLPSDVQYHILTTCVERALASPDATTRQLFALRCTCKQFDSAVTHIGASLVQEAATELTAFVLHATPMVRAEAGGWTYAHFGCPPQLLIGLPIHNVAPRQILVDFLLAKSKSKLSSGVCIERARRAADRLEPRRDGRGVVARVQRLVDLL